MVGEKIGPVEHAATVAATVATPTGRRPTRAAPADAPMRPRPTVASS